MESDDDLNVSFVPDGPSFLPGLISKALHWQLMSICFGIDFVIGVIGMAANIVTIKVYRRLGFNDSSHISLTALAISDFGVSLTSVLTVLAFLIPTIPGASFTSEIFMSIATPHVFLTRISALITTYLSVERCLCVLLPLKIKRMITTKRTSIAMVTIFLVNLGPWPYVFFRYPVGWKFYLGRNKTLLGVLPVTNPIILAVSYIVQGYNSLFLPTFTFFIVLFTTILLAVSLQGSRAWRDKNKSKITPSIKTCNGQRQSSTSESATVKSKEDNAVKMVIAIATVFIISTIPTSIHMVFTFVEPEFIVGGRYTNLYTLGGMIFHILNCTNCSVNVII